jgi:hypothetical protein
VDDGGSMAFVEGGERIKDLKLILENFVELATILGLDGISLCFVLISALNAVGITIYRMFPER